MREAGRPLGDNLRDPQLLGPLRRELGLGRRELDLGSAIIRVGRERRQDRHGERIGHDNAAGPGGDDHGTATLDPDGRIPPLLADVGQGLLRRLGQRGTVEHGGQRATIARLHGQRGT